MALNKTIDEHIKALEVQKLPAGVDNWYQHLDADTADSKLANLAAWALSLLENEWQVAAITQGLTEDDLGELEAVIEDMSDTRREIDGPGE